MGKRFQLSNFKNSIFPASLSYNHQLQLTQPKGKLTSIFITF